MDPDPSSPAPRKFKFAPKPPPRRKSKLITTDREPAVENDVDDEETQQALSRRVNEHLNRRGPKVEKKPSQVVFQHGMSSTSSRSFYPKSEQHTEYGNEAVDSKGSTSDGRQIAVTSISTAGTNGGDEIMVDLTDSVLVKKEKEYKEPWDYNSYYPVTLPLRKPHSGDPELLDKAEFSEAKEYDENALSTASRLDLLEGDDTSRMLFFTFPSSLPLGTRAASSKGKEIAGSSVNPGSKQFSKSCCSLEEFPEGYMGKMVIYKSGTVKLKIGNILYDVAGSDLHCPNIAMVTNTSSKHCCEVGRLEKRAVVSADIDSMMDD